MGQHPIEALMKTTLESIKEMVDVNTIVGDAVQTIDGTVIIPVSKVTFGFAAGGGEFSKKGDNPEYPFAGGSGAGISINPVAFMIVGRNNTIKMIPASPNSCLDRALDNIPNLIEQVRKALEPGHRSKKECDKQEKDKDKDKVTDENGSTLKYQDTNED